MKLYRVGMGNFLSFDSAQIPLYNQGLVLIRGDNQDNDVLSDNGAGKSTVIEAIVYALFGRTIRGLKADQVVNRQAKKNCWVELVLEDDNGNEYSIQRYRKHAQYGNKSRMLMNGVDVTPASEAAFNDKVVEILGADYTTFTSSVLYTGESFKFTSATDAEMKHTFDLMLGTSLYQKAKDVAAAKQSAVMSQLRLETQAVGAMTATLGEKKSSKEQYQGKSSEWADRVAQRRQQLQADVDAAQRNVSASKVDEEIKLHERGVTLKALQDAQSEEQKFAEATQLMDTLRQSISTDNATISSMYRQHDASQSAISSAELALNRESMAYGNALEALNSAKDDLESVQGSVGSPCPYCGRELTEEHLTKALQQAQRVVDAKSKLLEAAEAAKKQAKTAFNDAKAHSAALMTEITGLEGKVRENEALLKQAEGTIGVKALAAHEAVMEAEQAHRDAVTAYTTAGRNTEWYQRELDKAVKALEDFTDDNPYTDLIATLDADITALEQSISQKKDGLAELERQSVVLAFWVQAFSNQGIKSFILDSVTPYLNERANYYLGMLSDSHISVNFTTQTQLKSKEMREKFSIEVSNDDGGNMYNANSGGERKRVDLAINLALQDLVASRSCRSIGLSVWDEVFDALDNTGCEAVIRMLQELSRQRSTILVISHNPTIQSYFDDVWTVTKHNGLSTIHT